MNLTRKLTLSLCVLCVTFLLSILALGLVLVSGTQDVVSDLEIHYHVGGATFVVGNDCINPEDFAEIEVDSTTYTAVVEQPANPDVLGKRFEGWYTDKNLTHKIESFPATLTAGTKLYPSYYDANGNFIYTWSDDTNGYKVSLDITSYRAWVSDSETTGHYEGVDTWDNFIIPDIYNGDNGVAPVTEIDSDWYVSYDWVESSPVLSIAIGNHIKRCDLHFAMNDENTTLSQVLFGTETTYIHGITECSGLTKVYIPDSVTEIGQCSFMDCTGLTEVVIGNGLNHITLDAFLGCTSLQTVILGDSVKTIDWYKVNSTQGAFRNCTSLTTMHFGKSYHPSSSLDPTKDYSTYVLMYSVPALTNITIDSENPYYDSRDNCNAFIDKSTNTLVQGCNNTTIPDTVTSIGDDAFKYCTLSSITIPSSVTNISGSAFDYSDISNIVVDSANTKYDNRNSCNAIIETSTNTLFQGCKNTIIPDSVTSIGAGAFSYCTSLTSITIPNSVTSIGNGAFSHCTSLISITITDSVTSIGNDTFEGCSALTSVTIGSGVTNIGEYAFEGCSALTSVTFVDYDNWYASINTYTYDDEGNEVYTDEYVYFGTPSNNAYYLTHSEYYDEESGEYIREGYCDCYIYKNNNI